MSENLFELEKRLTTIQAARDQGISEVDYQGRRIRYRNMDVMDRAIQNLANRIASLRGSGRPASVRGGTVYSTKGIT